MNYNGLRICTDRTYHYYYGYKVVTLYIFPYEFSTSSAIINLYTSINFTINFIDDENIEIQPEVQSKNMTVIAKEIVKHKVQNPEEIDFVGGGPLNIVSNDYCCPDLIFMSNM